MEKEQGLSLPKVEGAQEPVYLMEADNGMLVRVPESRLAAWEAAQRGEGPKIPEDVRQRLRDSLVSRIYGSRE